jgi:hypothetical protein
LCILGISPVAAFGHFPYLLFLLFSSGVVPYLFFTSLLAPLIELVRAFVLYHFASPSNLPLR